MPMYIQYFAEAMFAQQFLHTVVKSNCNSD